jgi:trehalose 6-phosphate synthase
VAEYERYLAAIEETFAEVNDRHGDVIELRVADNFPQSVAAYKQFDVLLVNAVYDGMNLVAKEGPLVNERDGVLVLSENAGAHEELGEWCLTVNPFDVWGQAEALHEALSMGEPERRRRREAICEQVRAHDVRAWIDGLLRDLDAV